jgi:hypothetical protein
LQDLDWPAGQRTRSQKFQVTVFWHRDHAAGVDSLLRQNGLVGGTRDDPLARILTPIIDSHEPTTIMVMDPNTGRCLAQRPARRPNRSDGPLAQSLARDAPRLSQPLVDRLTAELAGSGHCDSQGWAPPSSMAGPVPLRVVWLERDETVAEVWRRTVGQVDAALVIAPQPYLCDWAGQLRPLAKHFLSMPDALLPRLEDKRYFTQVPSLVLEPQNLNMPAQPRIAGNAGSEEIDEPAPGRGLWGEGDSAVACPVVTTTGQSPTAWYQEFMAGRQRWALKPTNQCGGSDVWRIELQQAIPDFGQALHLIDRLRRHLPRSTELNQPLLLAPWVEGVPGSLSLIANPRGWWCLPPCQQRLEYSILETPVWLARWVHGVHRVQYVGADWDEVEIGEVAPTLVGDQFAQQLTAAQRRSVRGWVGLDYVRTPAAGCRLIEVNPRLTSSYHLLRHLHW